MRRKFFGLALSTLLFAVSFPVQAQQPAKVPRIGYVSGSGDANNSGPNVEAFRHGLRDLGYTEGKNILVEYRYIAGTSDRIPSLVVELVQLKVDVIVIGGTLAAMAAKKATTTIPIVFTTVDDLLRLASLTALVTQAGTSRG